MPDTPVSDLEDMTIAEWNTAKNNFALAYQERINNLIAAGGVGRRKKRDLNGGRSKRQATGTPLDINEKKVLLPQNKIYGMYYASLYSCAVAINSVGYTYLI